MAASQYLPKESAPPPPHSRDFLAKVTIGLVLFGGVLATLALLCGEYILAWYADPFRGTALPSAGSSASQLIGRSVDLPPLDARGRSIPRNRGLLLAPAPCGSCADPDAWIVSLQQTGSVPVVATFASRERDVQTALDLNAPRVLYVNLAATNPLARLLNDNATLFAATDATRRIVAVSLPSESADDFARRVGLK